ncbi:MAG: hypothetical protein ACK41V_05990 [Acidovorax sp.]|uniref:hypothetical protein n=1 Tax=Acidovorax sp. TaxID=1872122 RepID=UPI00391BAB34
MASAQKLQRLHKIIWALIYGGLLALVLGIATARTDNTTGWALMVVGGMVAVAGVVLIGVRARLQPDVER